MKLVDLMWPFAPPTCQHCKMDFLDNSAVATCDLMSENNTVWNPSGFYKIKIRYDTGKIYVTYDGQTWVQVDALTINSNVIPVDIFQLCSKKDWEVCPLNKEE